MRWQRVFPTASGPVTIGASVPLTGAQAAFGSYISWGYKHAVETINAQGGPKPSEGQASFIDPLP